MKKVLSLTIAAVILLAAALSFASCGAGEGIVGKWKTSIDFGEVMNASGEDVSAMFDASSLEGKTVDLVVEFKDNGKYVADFDQDQIKEVMTSLMEPLLESLAGSAGMSIDDVLKAQGASSIEELIDAQLNSSEGEDPYHHEGDYTYEDGKLTLEKSEIKVELSGDTLKFVEVNNSESDAEENAMLSEALLPLVFTRG